MDQTSPKPIQNRWALLVGINRYVELAFPSLKFCVKDVISLEQVLSDLEYTVVCLNDELSQNDPRFPTLTNIEAELTNLCEAVGTDDLLWVHFACHGKLIGNPNRQPVLVVKDTRYSTLGKTALPLAEVERLMRNSKAKRLVLTLDACHVGVEVGRDISDPEFIQNAYDLAEGFALIAASTAQQVAIEWEAVEHGVFTYYLLAGLAGYADRTTKEFVTVNDLQTYVLNALRHWRVKYGRIQEPTIRSEGLGDMILADYRQNPSDYRQNKAIHYESLGSLNEAQFSARNLFNKENDKLILNLLKPMLGCRLPSITGKAMYTVTDIKSGEHVALISSKRRKPSLLAWEDIRAVYNRITSDFTLTPSIVDSILRRPDYMDSSTMCALVLAMHDPNRIQRS